MTLLIDGYNLLHATGIMGQGAGPRGFERSRTALVNFVVESLSPEDAAQATIVFDAADAPPGLPDSWQHRGLTVRFARGYPNADELIEELIGKHAAPRRLTVVSSDHRLHRAARRRKATAIDSDRWYAEMLRQRSARRAAPPNEPGKPGHTPAGDELRYWLAQFGAGKPPDSEPPDPPGPDDDPFPPGFAEGLQ